MVIGHVKGHVKPATNLYYIEIILKSHRDLHKTNESYPSSTQVEAVRLLTLLILFVLLKADKLVDKGNASCHNNKTKHRFNIRMMCTQ